MCNDLYAKFISESDNEQRTSNLLRANNFRSGANCSYPVDGLEPVLREWSNSKRILYDILGKQFIATRKNVKIPFVREVAENKLYNNSTIENFRNSLRHDLIRYGFDKEYAQYAITNDSWSALYGWGSHEHYSENLKKLIAEGYYVDFSSFSDAFLEGGLLNTTSLLENRVVENRSHPVYAIYTPEGKLIKIMAGDKTMKAFSRLVEHIFFDLRYSFEEFRLEVSVITNDAALTGDLCLSIHPMDFMTMSDNAENWSSCMSWAGIGDYRAGTVEMMNSPVVVIGYLKSTKNVLDFAEEFNCGSYADNREQWTWNSKKWRCLFIVNNGHIISVKGYPYYNEPLLKMCLSWLQELYNENAPLSWDRLNCCEIGTIHNESFYHTNEMYCDMGCTTHLGIIHPDHKAEHINYSGKLTCMCCGSEFETRNDVHNRVHCFDCCDCNDYEYDDDDDDDDYNTVWSDWADEYIPEDDAIEVWVMDDTFENYPDEHSRAAELDYIRDSIRDSSDNHFIITVPCNDINYEKTEDNLTWYTLGNVDVLWSNTRPIIFYKDINKDELADWEKGFYAHRAEEYNFDEFKTEEEIKEVKVEAVDPVAVFQAVRPLWFI